MIKVHYAILFTITK